MCPKGCDKRDYEVYGNMIYEYSSHVCAAAIHAGHLDAKDGGIKLFFCTSQAIFIYT